MHHINAQALMGKNIVFIGGGNMASAIIDGLLSASDRLSLGLVLGVSDKNPPKLDHFAKKGIKTATPDIAHTLISSADVVVLAVKPQVMNDVAPSLAPFVAGKLVLSVMAGIPTERLTSWLGTDTIIRCMPNLPASIGYGATGLFADDAISQADKDTACAIMDCVGMTAWVAQECDLHAITAVAGSAPAYFFYVLEAMIDKAISMGLDKDTAQKMACMSLIGAGQLALPCDDIARLREQVTSKGGTTAQALATLCHHDVQGAFGQAMDACAKRSVELGEIFNA
ncbi:MAG: pyrroline-5-carboxylate reductase [Moraxella sp.]|nr:pyrroline-5-carboxylate reductase [Moraxella sp.]